MADITFRTVWDRQESEIVCDAREFWLSLDALAPEHIDQRVKELCAVAYDGGNLVAVSTVHFFEFPRLRSRFFYYRTTVAPGLRRRRLASRLCVYSRDQLAQWSREHPEEKMKGLFVVIEAEEFRSRQHVPIATQLDLKLILVGYTPSGHQLRVIWFPDATVE